ncbi:uncharacterized protein LOC113503276 isoform X2 [Trichoplusia ni]|uniref:Ubiquitin carboxyl-terminal hydrolase 14 n=1 Tax=Trichoplusia ni TaxID=7111 RepID=A0A7E5WJN0_TRINI|nr:uncharacterized protein LOC113503276 isoform X2 [Trichoplusia ni]
MPKVSVKVKWGKEMYPDVEVNTEDEPVVFKAQIFALTGVQPERQKVVCKGVTLRDDSWANFKLSNNALVLVMGSKEEDVPAAPVEQTRFVEDMNESELATALDMPEGLINLGNTCYMNATVQCLKTVPELKNALLDYDKSSGGGTAGELTSALSETMSALDGGGAGACAGAAAKLLRALHATAPRFAERGAGGGLAQQDASECWTEIVRALQARLPAAPGASALRYYPHTVWAAAWRSRTPPSAGQRSCARCRPACPPRPAPPRSGTTPTLYGRRPGAAGRLRVLDRDRARAAGPPARRARRLRAQVLPPHCMGGGLAQQDASECWTEIVRALQARLPAAPGASALRYYPHTVWAAAWRSRTPPSAGQRSCARCRPACPPRPAPPRSGTTPTLYGRRPGAAGRLRVLDRDRARAAGPPARRARRLRAQVLPPHCMGGGLAQQDASECWTEIVRALQARLPAAPGASALRYYPHTVWAAAWRSRTPPSAGQRSCARCRPACPPRPAPPRSGTTSTLYGRRPGAAGRLRVLDRDRARAAGPPARRARRLRAQVLPPHCMGGGLAQQDASECWTEIVRALQARLPAAPGASALRYYPHTVWAAAWRSRTPPSAGQRSCARCRPACPPRPAPPRSGPQ